MRALLITVVFALIPTPGFAQVTPTNPLATPVGHELNVGIGGYKYTEPSDLTISLTGLKFSGEYTGTVLFNAEQHWFGKANARLSVGSSDYEGWCAPWIITPDSTSPNGYALDLGEYSPCTDSGNKEWYLETRGLIGKDFIGGSWALSPEAGVGIRYLSSGLSDVSGFRTDAYLYIPIGLTARTTAGSHALSFNVEYDYLIRGWQNTYESLLGGGDAPATDTAPAFTLNGISDLAFAQESGWAVRLGGKFHVTRTMSLEPYFVHWRVDSSPVSTGTAIFTVNGITVQQQFGALEPFNKTNEGGVKLTFRF